MNRLSLLQTIAYDYVVYEGDGPRHLHYMNDTVFFPFFYQLALQGDKDAVDVGAHVGIQADMMLARTSGRVHCFEASQQIFDHLETKYRGRSDVVLRHVAVSDSDGEAEFFDTELWGAGSLQRTAGIEELCRDKFKLNRVRTVRLDDVLAGENNIGLIKLDIEGAEILALDGARDLIVRNQPYIVMEYCRNALAFKYRGEQIDRMTLRNFAAEIGYVVYNLYGICLSHPPVWESSVFRDSFDVFLVPLSRHDEWVLERLPQYQYHILDAISERIEWHPGNANHALALIGLPSRMYEVLNSSKQDEAREYLAGMAAKLQALLSGRDEILSNDKLSQRSKIWLTLIHSGNTEVALAMGRQKELTPDELAHYETIAFNNL